MLIDGGGSESYNLGENTLLPYLLSRRITSLDYIMVSHFDTDHCRRTFVSFRGNKSKECNNWKTI